MVITARGLAGAHMDIVGRDPRGFRRRRSDAPGWMPAVELWGIASRELHRKGEEGDKCLSKENPPARAMARTAEPGWQGHQSGWAMATMET